MKLNIAQHLCRSYANGPGERFVIWVQGCSFACTGCWNQEMWGFEQGTLKDVDLIVSEVLSTNGIEGVTFTGGEPFDQADALVSVVKGLKHAGHSVFIFTGYELDELVWDDARELISLSDVLVTGRYIENLKTLELPWRGSSNQKVYFLTARYNLTDMTEAASVEVLIDENAGLTFSGFPPDALALPCSS